METTVFKINGMTCMGCVGSVTRLLQAVPGVSNVNVSLADGTARVEFDGSATKPEALRTAVAGAGYEASP